MGDEACPECGRPDIEIEVRDLVLACLRGWWVFPLGAVLGAAFGLGLALYVGGHWEAKLVVADINIGERAIVTASGIRENMEGDVARFYLAGDSAVGEELVRRFTDIRKSWGEYRERVLDETLADAAARGVDPAAIYRKYYKPLPWIVSQVETYYVEPPWYRGLVYGIAGLFGAFLLILLKAIVRVK